MTLRLVWSGMFQGAFKHQVLKKGVDDVYYLKRADFQLPVPPLPTLEIGPEQIPDLREVFGIATDGTLWVKGPQDRDDVVGERALRVRAAIDYGEAEESFAPVDHELGNPFYGAMALSPANEILVVSNLPGFAVFDVDGVVKMDRAGMLREGTAFEPPPVGEPFWVAGAGDVACGPESFLVGGFPLNRVDHYRYDGKLLASLRTIGEFDLAREGMAKVAFRPDGRLIATTAKHLFLLQADGTLEQAIATSQIDMGGGNPDFHLWIAVDAQGRLWTQFYKGKEVAYGAFELPG